MGKNAASVLPDAVAAAMMTSCCARRSTGIASSCASRSPVQPLDHIHRRMRSSSNSILEAVESELEGGKFIAFHSFLCGGAVVGLNTYTPHHRSPIGTGMLLKKRQKPQERRDSSSGSTKVSLSQPLGRMGHVRLDPFIGEEILSRIPKSE